MQKSGENRKRIGIVGEIYIKIAVQPFGCMPDQICGRGLYSFFNRALPQGQIVSIDVDSSASKLNAYNRVKMLVDYKNKR